MSPFYHLLYLLVGLSLAYAIYYIHSCGSTTEHPVLYTALVVIAWIAFTWMMLAGQKQLLRNKCRAPMREAFHAVCEEG